MSEAKNEVVDPQEMQERILKESEEFLKKHKVTEIVQAFLDSENAKATLQKAYDGFMAILESHKTKVPESLKAKFDELHAQFVENKDNFFADGGRNVKIRIANSFFVLPDGVCEEMEKAGTLKKALEENPVALERDLKDVAAAMVKEWLIYYEESLH